jgi:hypothetical protein
VAVLFKKKYRGIRVIVPFLVYYTLFRPILIKCARSKDTVSLSQASSDKARLVSAVPAYFFVLGLATIPEAVSEEKKDSPHPMGLHHLASTLINAS